MIVDTNEDTATWTKLENKVSRVHPLPSEHIAVNVLEFLLEGWQDPHEKDVGIPSGDEGQVQRSKFELKPGNSTSQKLSFAVALLKQPGDSASAPQEHISPSAPAIQREGGCAEPSMAHP